ncbi:MAG TPA: response regulator [Pirellulales bacterium]|jgi:CheY-like chemotaxis protein|nr:response regulator [Pirellulales bacterium]
MNACFYEQPQLDEPVVDRPAVVLIVEDDVALSMALSLSLSKQGFETASSRSGNRALELAREKRFAAVLLDLHLPDADGLDICQQLVDDRRTCDVPVIIISGSDRPDVLRRCRAAGCQYFIRKPYDPSTLLIVLRHAIDESRQCENPEFPDSDFPMAG